MSKKASNPLPTGIERPRAPPGPFALRTGDTIFRGVGVIDDSDGIMCYHDHVKPGTMMAVSCPCPKCRVTC